MSRRASLALVRAPSFRPSFTLPRLGRPSARTLGIAGAMVVGLALGYVAARETSIFAVRTIDLRGETPEVAADLRPVLAEVDGVSLAALDRGDLEARLRAVPSVRHAHVDRAFPNKLTVVVRPERPLAVVRDGARAWLIAESGRVIRTIDPTARPQLPRIRIVLERTPAVGATLALAEVRASLAVLRAVGEGLAPGVLYAAVEDAEVELVLRDDVTVRLGPPLDLAAKLAAAGAVLASLSPEERAGLGYLDVSVPERVVAGPKSEPESES
jgi:cell division septal protein FtsQ